MKKNTRREKLSCHTVVPSFGSCYVAIVVAYLPIILFYCNTVAFIVSIGCNCFLIYLYHRENKMLHVSMIDRFKMRLGRIKELAVLRTIHILLFVAGIIVFRCGVYNNYDYVNLNEYLSTRQCKIIEYIRPVAPAPIKDCVQMLCETLVTKDDTAGRLTSLQNAGLTSTDDDDEVKLVYSNVENYVYTLDHRFDVVRRNTTVFILVITLDDLVCGLIHRKLISSLVNGCSKE